MNGGDLFFGGRLGPSWGRLGASWGRLGHLGGLWSLSWARLGACLGLSWPVLACLGLSWPVLTCLGLIFDRFLIDLEPQWERKMCKNRWFLWVRMKMRVFVL